jgi:AcrR family transcriptional regulator
MWIKIFINKPTVGLLKERIMARIVNKEEYEARRNEILDATQQLIYTKGYEQMTIQDILDTLQISKGAYYHYFNSKSEVLDSMVERMVVEEMVPILSSIVQDTHLSALEKLHHYFDSAVRWKTARRALMLELLRVWLSDENAIVRQKFLNLSLEHVTPLLTEIIRQGIQEGVFTTAYPEQTCRVIYYTLLGLSDTILELLISDDTNLDRAYIESTVTAYVNALNDAVERLLGAPNGSLHLLHIEALEGWFPAQETIPQAAGGGSAEPNGGKAFEKTTGGNKPLQSRKDRRK